MTFMTNDRPRKEPSEVDKLLLKFRDDRREASRSVGVNKDFKTVRDRIIAPALHKIRMDLVRHGHGGFVNKRSEATNMPTDPLISLRIAIRPRKAHEWFPSDEKATAPGIAFVYVPHEIKIYNIWHRYHPPAWHNGSRHHGHDELYAEKARRTLPLADVTEKWVIDEVVRWMKSFIEQLV